MLHAPKELDRGLLKAVNFSDNFDQYRAHIENLFSQNRQESSRFIWDLWTVPEQYHLLRSPLEAVLGEGFSQPLMSELGQFAQRELGLMALSHPWVSLYTEGCYQNWHTDPKHGPWAFVYSLTPESFFQKAKGGFTRIFNSFDENFRTQVLSEAQEESQILQNVSAKMNELIVFDPRRPHMVERVRGVESALDSRLVIHGWFTDPQPFLDGDLDAESIQLIIDHGLNEASHIEEDLEVSLNGYAALRLEKSPDSELCATIIRDNLIDANRLVYMDTSWHSDFCQNILSGLKDVDLNGDFSFTLPLVFGESE